LNYPTNITLSPSSFEEDPRMYEQSSVHYKL